VSNYWVVGAMWDGRDDQSEKFFRRGYWFLGWDKGKQPLQDNRVDQMRPGDHIAIKRMLGQGSPNIAVRALGVIKEIDEDDKRVYVDWFVNGLEREVPGNGCFASIHGPFTADDPWVKEVFHI
jgi:hypothetical protein